MRVFPDIPVCVKGNETRMGKGKGSFEYWACRVPFGRVVFEIGGGGIREEIAKQGMSSLSLLIPSVLLGTKRIKVNKNQADEIALRLAQMKLPVQTEFIHHTAPARLGSLSSSALGLPAAALPAPAQLAELDAKDEGSSRHVVLAREERLVEGLEGLNLKDEVAQPSA